MQFSSNLFWDIDEDTLDMKKNARFIIERVLSRGKLSDWEIINQHYSFGQMKKEVLQIRYLDKLTLNFCSQYFKTPKEKFRCFNQPQSIQQLWHF